MDEQRLKEARQKEKETAEEYKKVHEQSNVVKLQIAED